MGQRSTVKLTRDLCEKAIRRAEQYELWDAELAGFGLRIMPSGVKSFVVRYRTDGGGRTAKRRTYTLGRFGALTIEQARKSARAVLGAVANGEDPGEKRIAKRGEMLISQLRDLYEKRGCLIQRGKKIGQPMKPLTKQYTLARIDHHIVPLLGRKRIGDVSIADVEQFASDVASGKTARDEKVGHRKRIIVRGGEGAARKAVRDLSAMYSFAMRLELTSRNPVDKAAVRKTDNQRERFLTLEEVKKLGQAFDRLEAEGTNPKAIAIARLWALTGCRRNEIAALRWSEVDLDRGFLMLEESKTGRSVRPLGRAAIEILRSIDPVEDSEFVFPSTIGESYFQGTKTIWPKVKKLSGLHDVTPHTLRHTMGSTSTSAGQALALTGAILGHRNPRSTAIYAHVQLAPAKRAAERASSKIAGALGRAAPIRQRSSAKTETA
ncbi:MAG: site-specific integrase [Candidatus Andeanibacterium colombiense]|uniref:Site-specific integrase n=1 Tax=Candidatus Andeanibacterium colombiense TaxID=3121345 RepID=A0AAJ6BR33_9SPHN|nr:MAG: site-specific integrase [Sphingomonadaceae bacterium]